MQEDYKRGIKRSQFWGIPTDCFVQTCEKVMCFIACCNLESSQICKDKTILGRFSRRIFLILKTYYLFLYAKYWLAAVSITMFSGSQMLSVSRITEGNYWGTSRQLHNALAVFLSPSCLQIQSLGMARALQPWMLAHGSQPTAIEWAGYWIQDRVLWGGFVGLCC